MDKTEGKRERETREWISWDYGARNMELLRLGFT